MPLSVFLFVIAFTGGRTGMVSAATGAMAINGYLGQEHGLEYLLAVTVLTGVANFGWIFETW